MLLCCVWKMILSVDRRSDEVLNRWLCVDRCVRCIYNTKMGERDLWIYIYIHISENKQC